MGRIELSTYNPLVYFLYKGYNLLMIKTITNLIEEIIYSFEFKNYPPSWIPLEHWYWEVRVVAGCSYTTNTRYLIIPTFFSFIRAAK